MSWRDKCLRKEFAQEGWREEYDKVAYFYEGLARAIKDGREFYINRQGEEIE